MKRFKRLTAFALALTIALTGCGQNEMKAISALEKLSEAKYYDQKSHISFELSYEGGDDYFKEEMAAMKPLFDAFNIDYNASYEGSLKDGERKSHVAADAELDPITLSGEMWVSLDESEQSPKFEIIAKVPALVKALMPDEYGKDYLYLDYYEYMDAVFSDEGIQSYSMSNYSLMRMYNYQKYLQNGKQGLIELAKNSKALSGNYTLSETNVGGKETLTFKMSDSQFKGFITAFISELKTDGELLDILLDDALGFSVAVYEYAAESGEDVNELKQEFVNSLDEAFKEYFSGIPILGDGGLVYEIVIDENGFAASESITANICYSEGLMEFAPYYFNVYDPFYLDEDSGTVNITIKIKTDNTDINSGKTVKFPALTNVNSVDLVEAMKEEAERTKENELYYFPRAVYSFNIPSNVEETPVDFPIVGTFNNAEFSATMTLINEEYICMPLRQAAEIFGGEVEWNTEYRCAVWKHDDGILVLPPEDQFEYMYEGNGEDLFGDDPYIAFEGPVIDGTAYVGLSEIEYFLDIDFGFDNETGTILIR